MTIKQASRDAIYSMIASKQNGLLNKICEQNKEVVKREMMTEAEYYEKVLDPYMNALNDVEKLIDENNKMFSDSDKLDWDVIKKVVGEAIQNEKGNVK